MSPALSALIVVSALFASGALLVRLALTESRRTQPARARPQPQAVPSPPLPAPAPPPPLPAPRPAPAWTPARSADGAWLWTASGWVPARWAASTPPPPAVSRSHGCASAAGVGCVLALGMAALGVLAVVVVLAALGALLSAIGASL
jgi:hypothetical protein